MIYAINEKTKEHQVCKNCDDSNAGEVLAGLKTGETWRMVQADADGWIKWEGGECPLAKRAGVDVIYLDGTVREGASAGFRGSFRWDHCGLPKDIIAYRPILEDKQSADEYSDEMPCEAVAQEWPPIGERVRIVTAEGDQGCADVVAHHNGGCVVWQHSDMEYRRWHREFIRPIRSEEDQAVDDMKAVAGVSYVKPEHMEMITRALYRAGYRKTNTSEEK